MSPRLRRIRRELCARFGSGTLALIAIAPAYACAREPSPPPRTEPAAVQASATIPLRDAELARRGPRREVLDLALNARECARARGRIDSPLLTVIDYSLPSVQKRLWVIDVASGTILFHELVAHGRNSGENLAVSFSNENGSKKSSLGLFRTADVYDGAHGITLRLVGLENGVNDRAEERAIVIHGAVYVSDGHIRKLGRLGRSWGCPALDVAVARTVIERIRGGSALFVYYPDPDWLRTSEFLHCDARPE